VLAGGVPDEALGAFHEERHPVAGKLVASPRRWPGSPWCAIRLLPGCRDDVIAAAAAAPGPGSVAGHAAGSARHPAAADMGRRQPELRETVGQVHWPSGEIVMPQLLPLPFDVADKTYSLGYAALTFQVE
jgi:hypothetical protein